MSPYLVSKLLRASVIALQFGSTFMLLLVVYGVFALMDCDWGFDGLIGLLVFQPILGAIVSSLSIGICFLVGLPVRMNRTLNSWWKKHYYIAASGSGIGLLLVVLSALPPFTGTVFTDIEEAVTPRQVPHSALLFTGWFLIAFMTLHIYPPFLVRKPA